MTGQFTKKLEDFALKVKRRSDDAVSALVTTIVAKIDERSPVGDPNLWVFNAGTKEAPRYVNWLAYNDPDGYVGGRFRANWQLGVDVKPDGEVNDVAPRGDDSVLSANLGKIPEGAFGHTYWYVNNLPYAQPLENGWSSQAPAGMVGLTIAEFDTIVSEAVDAAKRANP